MQQVGKLNLKIYQCICKNIITDEVVITDERIEHIKQRHPNDFERFHAHLPEIIKNPDYIIKDDRPSTAVVLKEIIDTETKEHFRLALRLVTPTDDPKFKNSIITFMKVREKEYQRLIRNKFVLYKRE